MVKSNHRTKNEKKHTKVSVSNKNYCLDNILNNLGLYYYTKAWKTQKL